MAEVVGALSTISLIFGGCCSNVFTLEAIVKTEPDSGLLITFFQFVFVTLAAYPFQCSPGAPYTLAPSSVPFRKWAFIALMFWGVNMLNNWAFAFSISVPVHIILRSFGSVITMVAGWLRGRTYTWLQILSVMILTAGVIVTSWADAETKGKNLSATSAPQTSTADFTSGLSILLIAQVLSAYMGVYVQDTYAAHGADWAQNLFYSHFLSLPLFLPVSHILQRQYTRLSATPPLDLPKNIPFEPILGALPGGLIYLLINAVTQLACISGVNVLSSRASAVTVTIVLNVRKLVSFILSTYLFGHTVSAKMALGAGLVFGSGALYGWETSFRIPRTKKIEGKKQQ